MFLFIPVFFAGRFFEIDIILQLLGGFLCFSLVASSIYIINDYRDIEDDKKHPVKKLRPLASGTVNKSTGLMVAIVFLVAGPVSYTHLDVYKRQDVGCGSGQFLLLLTEFAEPQEVFGIEISDKLIDNAQRLFSSIPPVSYTHLDVYKRQL